MAFYKKLFNKKTNVYYPIAVTVGNPVETREVAERLAQISTVSKSDVAAVLGDLAGVLADYMKQGKSVRLDGLGTFRYTLDTKGVKSEAEFDFQKQENAVRVQFNPERHQGGHPRAGRANGTSWPTASNGCPPTACPANRKTRTEAGQTRRAEMKAENRSDESRYEISD